MSASTCWPAETSHGQPKFAKPDAHFARIASYCPFAVVQVHAITQQFFHIENRFFAIAEVLANICMLLSCNEL
jgi:hypothetical protein